MPSHHRTQYLCRWVGYGPESDQWVNKGSICDNLLIDAFELTKNARVDAGHPQPASPPKARALLKAIIGFGPVISVLIRRHPLCTLSQVPDLALKSATVLPPLGQLSPELSSLLKYIRNTGVFCNQALL